MANIFAAEIARTLADIAQTKANIARDQALLAADPTNERLKIQIASGQEYLIDLDAQLAFFQQTEAEPVASSGQVVAGEQQARSDDSTTQTPQSLPETLAPTGRVTASDIETGTNPPTIPLTQSQATPPNDPVLFSPNDDDGNPLPSLSGTGSSVGVGSAPDDNSVTSKNTTKTSIDNVYGDKKIEPQPNVLDQYASYTYSASLYLMKPEALTAMINTGKKSIAGSQLLVQSGGAPVLGRNEYFSKDYYIDKIELKSSIAGKGSQASHNVNTVSMTLVEPNGITFLKNLDQAVQKYLGGTNTNPPKKKNFSAQLYLLVIRFYGYDVSGNLVQGGQNGAHVEKYYPLVINNIKFKVANKLVEYEIEASSPKYTMNVGQSRGSIPYNIELAAMTVKEALVGASDVVSSSSAAASGNLRSTDTAALNRLARENGVAQEGDDPSAPPAAPPTADAAPNPKLTVRKGIIEAMNQFQQDLVKRKIYTYPDVYSVEFVTPAIEQAKIRRPGGDKKSGGSAAPATAKDQLDPKTQSYDSTTRIVSATAGTQLVQFLDTILRNSSYIEDQQLVKVLEDSGIQVKNGSPAKNLAWYKISLEATPGKYDPKRNDYAYNMKYIIHPYKINEMRSRYFAQPKFNGVHKQYNYWFTGENTQILSYEQNYNSLYSSILSGGPASPYNTDSDSVKWSWQTRSNESSQQAAGRVNEIAANAADYLYNPSDLATANLTIVGDPAWLQQGEAFATPTKTNFNFSPFLADGTINYEAQQILFEILINTPEDYNLATGLMDPNQRSVINPAAKKTGSTRQSYVYYATLVTSSFVKGKFTQNLTGSLLTYFNDQSVKAAADSGRSTRTTATNAVSTAGGSNTSRTNTNSANTPDNEWSNQDGVSLTSENPPNSPDAESQEGGFYGESSVQPSPGPDAPTSNGDIIEEASGLNNTVAPEQNDQSIPSVEEPDYFEGLAGTTDGTTQNMAREA